MSEPRTTYRGIIESIELAPDAGTRTDPFADSLYGEPINCGGCASGLVGEEWRGRATVRCGQCGQRWEIEVRTTDDPDGVEFLASLLGDVEE